MIAQTLPDLPSKIDANPLLAALFDLPPDVQVSSITNGHRLNSTSSTPSSSRIRRSPDDGVETDTSLPLLHGESISLTDEEFSDAVAVAQDEPPATGSNIEPSSFATYHPNNVVSLPAKLNTNKSYDENAGRGGGDSPPLPSGIGTGHHHCHPVGFPVGVSKRQDDYFPRGGRSSPPLFHIDPQQQHYARLPESAGNHPDQFVFREGRSSPPLGISTHNYPTRFLVDENKCPDEYVSRGERLSPPFGTMGNKSPTKQNSPKKKKKKRRSAAIKSLKKLVGRKSKSSSTALAMASSFDDSGSLMDPPAADIPHSYYVHVGGGDRLPNAPQNAVDDSLSPERLASLKLKIGRIRSTIHSLEGDLITTRNELARAHQRLHWATMELADMQREALEAEVGLSNLVHQHEGGCISTSALPLSPLQFFETEGSEWNTTSSRSPSTSSDHLHYFTPTSSTVDSGEDSNDCSTPQSLASNDSFLSPSEKDYISVPFLDEAAPREEREKTWATRNSKPKRETNFKFDRGGKVSNALKYGMDASKEPNSICTPSTANSIDTPNTASSVQEEVPPDQMNGENKKAMSCEKRSSGLTPEKQETFIRAHDLALADDKNSLLPLHKTGVKDVVSALFDKGFELAMDETERWLPESGTGKILSKHANMMMDGEVAGPMGQWPNAAYGHEVLVWTAKCPHDGHGSQYPIVKGRGIIPTSAHKLVELLLDSGKVKQYNKMSLGRIDEQRFAKGPDRPSECPATGIRGETKIVRSRSQLPVVRRPVELRLLLHTRRLPPGSDEQGGARYLLVGRSVWETERGTAAAEDASATARCEMLLSVNMIRDIRTSGSCELTTITHGVSPGIPISIGKRIGLAAAAKYIRDVRAVFEKNE